MENQVTIKLTAEQAEQFKKEGKITIEMPKKVLKLKTINGWYIDMDCDVMEAEDFSYIKQNMNVYATKEQAEASIAQARLTQEMKLVNGDWMPCFKGSALTKYSIVFYNGKPKVFQTVDIRRFLVFKDRLTAEKFLQDHYDLIMAYKPLA